MCPILSSDKKLLKFFRAVIEFVLPDFEKMGMENQNWKLVQKKYHFVRQRPQRPISMETIIEINHTYEFTKKGFFLLLGLIEYKLQSIHCELLRSFIYEGLLKVPTNVPIMKWAMGIVLILKNVVQFYCFSQLIIHNLQSTKSGCAYT